MPGADSPTGRGQSPDVDRGAPLTPTELTLDAAASALVCWRTAVRSVLLTAAGDGDGGDAGALRALAAWYERMAVDPAYTLPPPEHGERALAACERSGDRSFQTSLALTRHAIRVARELACCRATWTSGAPSAQDRRDAVVALERALKTPTPTPVRPPTR